MSRPIIKVSLDVIDNVDTDIPCVCSIEYI